MRKKSVTITEVETRDTKSNKARVNWAVFLSAAIVSVGITLWAFVSPGQAQEVLWAVVEWTAATFGWFYVALAAVVLIFVIAIALSRFGHVKLGKDDSEPEFTTLEWASMLFAAGISTDLMFFAVAEPVTQYLEPPSTEPETVAAAKEATVWALFHYGISGWGMYALMGMALAYFAYRARLPLAARSALAPTFGRRIEGAVGDTVDFAALLGTIFGVATSLGIGVVMVNVGLSTVFGWPVSTALQIAIVVIGVSVAALSAVSGVDKGIKYLSLLNVFLAIGLTLWVLFTGKTQFLLEALVTNIGDFVALFPTMVLETFAHEDTGSWMTDWTIFFWAWWVAWASFVGLFLARISKGRTIRQFVAGTLTIPFVYVLMWISIYGNAALDIIRSGDSEFGTNTVLNPEGGFYELLSRYPGFVFVAAIATLTALLFYVTSADSAALVMANLSSRLPSPETDGRASLRIFWAVTTGALTIAMLLVGGIGALQSATVIMGLPFSFVMVFVMIGLYRALNSEDQLAKQQRRATRETSNAELLALAAADPDWQGRLSRILGLPNWEEAEAYQNKVLVPALMSVAEELRDRGVTANVQTEALGSPRFEARLTATTESGQPFSYTVNRVEDSAPAYGTRLPSRDNKFVRFHSNSGQNGYAPDVLGYSREQLIHDVLNHYERHVLGQAGESDDADAASYSVVAQRVPRSSSQAEEA